MDGNGAGVGGAQVLVDGLERSVTDESGYYKLDQVSSNNDDLLSVVPMLPRLI